MIPLVIFYTYGSVHYAPGFREWVFWIRKQASSHISTMLSSLKPPEAVYRLWAHSTVTYVHVLYLPSKPVQAKYITKPRSAWCQKDEIPKGLIMLLRNISKQCFANYKTPTRARYEKQRDLF